MGWAEVSDVGSIGGKPMTPTLGMDRGVLLTAYSVVVPVIEAIAKAMAACLRGQPLPVVSRDEQLRLAV
jgi:hypothetical protein